jgi:amino acid adenylation domain-containing protein
LDEQSNQIASLLHKYHVQSGSIVCILLERGIDLIASLLGVLKLNAAFVLIDRDHQPVNRTQLILDDCKASVVLMHEEDQTQFHGPVRVNIEASTEGTVMPTVPSRKASLDDLAYICYTSGSTGTPKGVMISQRALVNLCHGYRDIFDLKSGVHCGQYSSMTFDAAIGEIMPALISGAQLIIMPDTIKTDILALCTFINTHDLHHLFLPTAVYGLIHDYDLPGLKTLIVAGEPLHRMVVKSYRLFNAYGPTENAVCTTLKEVNRDDKITIGQPIANVQTYIVDALLRPVPIGVVGELMIGGKSLAKGYINQPEKTQERFIDSPFQPDEQLFKTGDMCRFLPNGDIEYEGRRDFQVKIRGMRVELDEIDACLQQNSDIKVAASIFDEQHQCIRCFIQPEDFINPAVYDEKSLVRTDWLSELFTHLKLSLPSYMTPSTIDILRVMPLNENGKIDRKALKKLKPQINHVVNEELPTSPIELQLAHLWQEILPIKTIGRQQSFFDLGGHSLMIAELKLKIHHTFAKNPSINDLYRHQTIASQAQWIEQNSIENTTDDILLPLAPDDNKSPVFLIHPINGDAGCYVHLTRRLRPNFSVYALQSAALKLDDERLSIENLAREYIKEIKTIENQQTYTLIGWSMGGIIAFEMAKQLSEEGLTAKVIMLDSYLPDYLTLKRLSHEEHQAILIRLFMQQLQALYGIDFDAEFHLSDFAMQLEEVLSNSMILKIEQDKIMRELQFYQRHHLALMNYQPSKAPVELLFIYCTEMFDLFVPPQKEVIKKYWSQYLDGVPCRIEAIKANHLNLLTPQFLSIQMTIIYEFLGMKIE